MPLTLESTRGENGINSAVLQIEDHELADVAAVSAGNDYQVGNMISNAFQQVGRTGVVTIEKGKCLVNNLQIVEGMQFNRGYLSPYFVTDRRKREVEYHDCKVRNKTSYLFFPYRLQSAVAKSIAALFIVAALG